MFYRAAKNINIIGNEITQVSGVGMCVDYMKYSYPEDRALNDRCEYVVIENNYVHNIAMDYEGGAANELGRIEAAWFFKMNELGPFIVDIDAKGNNYFDKLDGDIAERKREALKELGIDPDYEFTKLY